MRGKTTSGNAYLSRPELAISSEIIPEPTSAVNIYDKNPAAARYAFWYCVRPAFLDSRLWLSAESLSLPSALRAQDPGPSQPEVSVSRLVDAWTYSIRPATIREGQDYLQPLYFNYNRLPECALSCAPLASGEVRLYLRLNSQSLLDYLPLPLTLLHRMFSRVLTGHSRDSRCVELVYHLGPVSVTRNRRSLLQLALVHALFASLTTADEFQVAALDHDVYSAIVAAVMPEDKFTGDVRDFALTCYHLQLAAYRNGPSTRRRGPDSSSQRTFSHDTLKALPMSALLLVELWLSTTIRRGRPSRK